MSDEFSGATAVGDQSGFVGEKDASLELENGFTKFKSTIQRLDAFVPKKDLEIWEGGLTGTRVPRRKEFNRNTSFASFGHVVKDRFPSEEDQVLVLDSINTFLDVVAAGMDVSRDLTHIDGAPLGQLDRFLVGLTTNVIGDGDTSLDASTTTKVLKIGTQIVTGVLKESDDHRAADSVGKRFYNDNVRFEIGTALLLAREAIPALLSIPQEVDVLDVLDEASNRLSLSDIHDLVKYYQKSRILSDAAKARLQHISSETNPLVSGKEDPEGLLRNGDPLPWKKESVVGMEERKVTWSDLIDAVSATVTNEREYCVNAGEEADGSKPIVNVIRGSEHNVHNRPAVKKPKMVAFHTHPSHGPNGPYNNAFVSPADMQANVIQDYGGGYLNIAYHDGITIHIGSVVVDDDPRTDSDNPDHGKTFVRMESGGQKNEEITQITNAMREAKGETKPFIYSYFDTLNGIRYFFVSMPWKDIDPSINLHDLSFGNGLPAVLKGVEELPDLPKFGSLVEVLEVDGRLRGAQLSKKYMEDDRINSSPGISPHF